MDVAPERKTTTVRGQPAGYWRIAGPEGAPRVLLVHGLGASNHIWEPLARALPPALDLWALDLPGSGTTPGRGPLGPPELAAFAAEFMDAAELPRADVVAGHSLGGAVALELGLAAPARVGGLMIFNAAPALPWLTRLGLRAPGVDKLLALPALMPTLPAPTRLFTQLYLWSIFGERRGVTSEVVEGYAKLAESPEFYRNMAETLSGFARHTRKLNELQRLAMPASIVWGERDPLFPVGVAERLAVALPQAALHRLPRVGHCPPQEDPALVATLMLDLVSRVRRAGAQRAGQVRARP